MEPVADHSLDITESPGSPGAFAPVHLPQALTERMRGPGGLYNVGNFLGLTAGIGVQLGHQGDAGTARAVVDYLAGDVSALVLTLATLVFFVSGEAYHRAWQKGFPPDTNLNRLGDLLSGVGALLLGAALFMLGDPLLAATAGLLHAAGKFGSAVHQSGKARRIDWGWMFRASVVASRVPAMLVAVIGLGGQLPAIAQGASPVPALMPATLLVCYALWAKADLMLFRQ